MSGSVGARTAPSRSAAAGARPTAAHPRNAVAAMVSGMQMASSRQVGAQDRQLGARSIMSPAPVSETITTSRSEEHTSELQSLMRISYAVFCLKKKNEKHTQ